MRALPTLALAVTLGASAGWAHDARAVGRVTTPAEIDRFTEVESVRHDAAGRVTGLVRNTSDDTLRDVRVLIQLVYHWPNEMHPGAESPSDAVVAEIAGPLEPGETAQFDATLPTGAPRGDFEPRVKVLGFTAVGPPTAVIIDR
jgi:hypothetical protein